MPLPSLLKLGPRTPDTALPVLTPPPRKIARENALSRRWLSRRYIIRFRSNFLRILNAWHPKCCRVWLLRGQGSRSRRDVACAEIRQFINNSDGDCSISLTFRTDFDHVTLHASRTFKVNRSKVKVTDWHNIPYRAFPVAGSRLWNSLPTDVTSATTLPVFCSCLKTYLFYVSFPAWVVLFNLHSPSALAVCINLRHLKYF